MKLCLLHSNDKIFDLASTDQFEKTRMWDWSDKAEGRLKWFLRIWKWKHQCGSSEVNNNKIRWWGSLYFYTDRLGIPLVFGTFGFVPIVALLTISFLFPISRVAPPRESFKRRTNERYRKIEKERGKAGIVGHLNPLPLDHQACCLPLCYNRCPTLIEPINAMKSWHLPSLQVNYSTLACLVKIRLDAMESLPMPGELLILYQ